MWAMQQADIIIRTDGIGTLMEGGRRVIQTGIADFKEIRESNLIYHDFRTLL